MCKDCCVEQFVDRGDIVHESGSYFVNFKQCAECGVRTIIKNENQKSTGNEDEDDDEIEITFEHFCSKCNHKICEHFYSYELEDGHHKYIMQCALCGRGAYEQFAGIKKQIISALSDHDDEQKSNDSHQEDNNSNKQNKASPSHDKIVLNLSALTQSIEVNDTHIDDNENENDSNEWNTN
mmetsp:Transcript_34088/g.55573  ORF Transcript_34088/g.55573 Transcript_34088/m.55573 type:complete len:180 (-) Transcript_34088:188-727(-)